MVRGHESTDGNRILSTVAVGVAGGLSTEGRMDERSEVILPGSPLIPWGRAVEVGEWSTWWTPETGPCMAQLSVDKQQILLDLSQGSGVIRPVVFNYVPYLTPADA